MGLTTSLSRAMVKNERRYTSTPLYSFLTCASRDNAELPSCAVNPCFVPNKKCDSGGKTIIGNQQYHLFDDIISETLC